VQLLYRQQRYDEAEQEIRRLQRQAPTPELQRLIVDIALRKQDPLQAAQEALDAVAADSNDYRDHVWLGQVLALTGQQPEQAEKHLRKAVELGPGEPETWLALVQFLASNGRRDEAEEVITQARSKIAAERVPLALAQCYEVIGNLKSAEEQYQAFLKDGADDVMRLRSVAAFYLRIGLVSKAEPLLRKLMDQTKNETDAAWARRSLAMALALAGDQRRMIEAQQLVGSGSEDPVELRARARVLASLPLRSQRAQAIKLLEDLAQKQTLPIDDQFLLAKLYQDSGVWPKARDILRELTTHGHNPQHLTLFANCLLRLNQLADAERLIDRLEKLEKDRQLPAGTSLELRLQLLEAKGQGEQALMLARKFVEADAKRSGRVLVWLASLIRQKRYDDVLTFWSKAKNDGPPELISGAAVASLRGGQMNAEQCAPVQVWLEAALEKQPQAVGLMLHLADLHDLCGRYREAEAVYRRVLAVDADNVVALNNLAWLLAQQTGKGDEALPLITRAIDRAGTRAELLDTRASAYLALRQTDKAIADLESANADQPTASRYFLLAQAQRQANNTQRAADLLRRATAAGLKAEQLHPAERSAFLKLQQELEQR
jgi:tetratricopeptide (TPR) repeat protein